MTLEDNPEIGRLIASKDHDYPFYFDGEKFRSVPFNGEIQLDSIRSNGDFFTMPVYSKEAVDDLKAQLSSLRAENQDKDRLLIEYRKLLDPILDWGQTEGLEHGLKLGESITTAVLNRAKEYNQLRKRCEDLEAAIDKAYDWLKNPNVPIQSVITVLRKAREKKLLSQ